MILALLLLFGNAVKPTNTDIRYVDAIEVNHYCPEDGPGFSQVIFRRWSPDYRRLDICFWRLGQELRKVGPYWEYQDHTMKVRSRTLFVTETKYDVEARERKLLPPGARVK